MNIIELARQAGFLEYELDDGTTEAFDKRYARFAALVEAATRADEREQIAAWYEAEGQMTFPVAIPKIIRAGGTT